MENETNTAAGTEAQNTLSNYYRDTAKSMVGVSIDEVAELPHIRIHDFRHSYASLLANNAINIQEIARRLGHSKIEMTWNTYSHLYPKEEERAVNLLNDIKIQ